MLPLTKYELYPHSIASIILMTPLTHYISVSGSSSSLSSLRLSSSSSSALISSLLSVTSLSIFSFNALFYASLPIRNTHTSVKLPLTALSWSSVGELKDDRYLTIVCIAFRQASQFGMSNRSNSVTRTPALLGLC